MSVQINMREFLEAGVHYGHQTRRWNPKMKPYIFGSRNGIHIIDLQKTVKMFKKACDFLELTTARGGHVLFIGTKRLARELIAEEAKRSGMHFINYRWLGGTLTNFPTIRQSIHRLKRYEKMRQDGTFSKLTKKEALGFEREILKLDQNLGGIKDMPGMPRAVFIIDAHKEDIAVKEAQRLGIPIVAITDTNCDPTGIDFPIPGNDDSLKSLKLFVASAAEACIAGRMRSKDFVDEESGAKFSEGSFRDDAGNSVAVERKN
jgi:small subunit ribosomal protein S2